MAIMIKKIKARIRGGNHAEGFTLIEFLVALAVGSIVTAVIYLAFTFQQQTWVTQDQLATMQQNLRMSLRFIARDVMVAGYDPLLTGEANFISPETTNTSLRFTMDISNDLDETAVGSSDRDVDDVNEDISYYLQNGQICRDDLNTTPATICDVVAEDIEQLRFYYILEDGSVLANPTAGQLDLIRYVRVVILARTEGIITQHTTAQNFVYINQFDPVTGVNFTQSQTFNDNRRRLLLAMNVQCRNKGL